MRQLFSRLLVVVLLVLACSGAAWGDNLTVTITKKGGGSETKIEQESLGTALKGYWLDLVEGIEVSAGSFETADWKWLKGNRENLKNLKKFEVTDAVNSVADIPDTPWNSPYFREALNELHVAKLKRVGKFAFHGCSGLTSVSLPVVQEIGDGAFLRCTALTNVSLPAAKEISYEAFRECSRLTSVSLPEAKEIGDGAFYLCTDLTSVSLPAATKIVAGAFESCTNLTLLQLPVVTEIGGYAFMYCGSLTSVSLPETKEIGNSAFANCKNLRSLQLGATAPSVGSDAFSCCPVVRRLELIDANGSPLTGDALTNAISRYKAVEDGDTEDNLWYGWAFEDAPSGHLSGTIDGVAFSDATSLEVAMQGKKLRDVKEVTITGGSFQVTDWGFLLEQGQHELAIEKFTVESSVDKVIDIPDLPSRGPRYLPLAKIVSIAKIQKIGEMAFAYCGILTSVSLPAATEIGYKAFDVCERLESVSLPAATKIGESAFGFCKGLTHVSLPAATKIGESAFLGCTALTILQLPVVTEIDLNAFSRCSGLTHVSLPAATKIGKWAFDDCKSLTGVSLPTATTIEDDTFKGCESLESISLPAAISIGDNTFKGCERLESVSLPAATSIGDYTFKGCGRLESVSLPAATRIGNGAFEDCKSLTSVSLPAATKIGNEAFKGCGRLESISLPAAEVIAGRAFSGCERLTILQLGATPPSVWSEPFDGCPKVRTLIIINRDGVPLVGPALSPAADAYDRHAGDPYDGKWHGFAIEKNPPTLLLVKIVPSGASAVKIIRKKDGAMVNQGNILVKGDVLEVQPELVNGYWPKSITAEGAKKIGDKEWEVTAEFGQPVTLTVEFEKVATLGATIKTPADAGELTITRKDGGAVVKPGNALKEGEVLVVEARPGSRFKVKAITAEGAKKIGENEWEVTAKADEQVIYTVEFEKLPLLGATTVEPSGAGEVTIRRKDDGAVVEAGDALESGKVLVVTAEAKSGYKYKSTTAAGADDKGNNEWEVKAKPGEKVIFTVTFEKESEGEGGNNNNDPTPVENVLLGQARLSPNPTDGQVTIDAGTTLACCAVYNSTGVLLQAIESPKRVFTIDLTASPSGVYLVRLVDMQGGCKTLRVVKQ